jgi:hypothetical protein
MPKADWVRNSTIVKIMKAKLSRILTARTDMNGSEHSDVLDALHSFAFWTGRAGDPDSARDLFKQLALTRSRTSGPTDPYTLTARANFAAWLGRAGDAAKARDLLEDLLPAFEHDLGPEDPDTLSTHGSLAR